MGNYRMGERETITLDKEYTVARVPQKGRQRLIKPLAVWFGYAFGPVAITSAAMVSGAFTFTEMMLVTFVGCLLLICISGVMGWIGQREGMTFSLICRYAWGTKAYRIAALIIPIGLIGWSSIHLFTVGMFCSQLIVGRSGLTPVYYIAVIVALLFIGGSAVKGINTVTYVGFFAVPLILALLGITGLRSLNILGTMGEVLAAPANNPGSLTFAAGVTAMVGSFACGAGGASPDIQRFCKKQSYTWVVSVVTFGVAYPFLMFVSSLIALATGASAFVEAYDALHMLPAGFIAVFLLAWSTINADYYTASLSFAGALGVKRETATICIAFVGGILALLGSGYYLEHYLTAMTAFMVPIVGVVFSDYFLVNKGRYPEPELTVAEDSPIPPVKWGAVLGYVVGIVTLLVSEKTSFLVPPVNCIVMTAFFHWIGCKISGQQVNYNEWCDEKARAEALAGPTYEELNQAE